MSVCIEYGKSALKEADFYGGKKKEYWLKQSGRLSHRELLKADIDTALAQSTNFKAFEIRLTDIGYVIQRDKNFAHYSVKAPSCQRAVRLDRLCKEYTPATIRERLLVLEIEYRKMLNMDGIQVLFELIIELCKLITGNNISPVAPRPLSPEMRQEVVKLNKTLDEYKFLCEKQIDPPQELVSFISATREQISKLGGERQSVYNRNRHKKSETLNAEARDITAKIKPLRKELFTAKAIFEKIPRFEKLLETESVKIISR